MVKSELLNITLQIGEQKAIQTKFPLTWCRKELGDLGIKLTSNPNDLFKANYIPLLNKIKDQLNLMRYRSLSWIGRINAVKMFVLPMLIYTFRMIPIAFPSDFFRKLQSMVLRFIWARKRPRIAYDILIKEKRQRGLGAPDMKK